MAASAGAEEPDAARGLQLFVACAPCHSLSPGDHLAGPSLAGFWMRRAGSAPGFERYSPAMLDAALVWNETTLDRYLLDSESLAPGSPHALPMEVQRDRAHLIAFLKRVADAPASEMTAAETGTVEGFGVVIAAGEGVVTIEHGEIAGVMGAMTMTYAVDVGAELAALRPGERISFTLDRATLGIVGLKRLAP